MEREDFASWGSSLSFVYLGHPEPQSWRKEGRSLEVIERKVKNWRRKDRITWMKFLKVFCHLDSSGGIPSETQLCNTHEIQRPLSL